MGDRRKKLIRVRLIGGFFVCANAGFDMRISEADFFHQFPQRKFSFVWSVAVLFSRNLGEPPFCRHGCWNGGNDGAIFLIYSQGDGDGFAFAVFKGFHFVKLDFLRRCLLDLPISVISSGEAG